MFIESLEDRRLLAWDTTISSALTVNISSSTAGGVTTFTATGTGANLDWQDVDNALLAGNSVVVDSGSTGTESGNITDQTGANLTGLPGGLSLTIESGSGTNLVGDISIEGINLDSASSSIVVNAAGNVSTGLLSGGTFASPAALASASLTAGGAISAQTSPLPGPISAVNVNLSAVTGIGASGNDLPISATNLTSDTSSGNGNQFLSGAGSVNLNTANALNAGNGAITLDGGAFQIQAAAGGNAISDASSLTVNSPATLDLAGNSESVDGLSGNGTVTSSVIGPVTLTVGASGGGGSFNGLIQNGSGTVQLTKAGAGTQILSSNNSYSGVTLVNGGVLNIQSGGALGSTAAGTTVAAGAALQVQGNISVGEPLTLNGNGVSNDGALRNMATNNFWSGSITLASDSTIGGTTGAGNELVLFNSIGESGGARSLDVVGPISLVMQGGANTYTGTTTVVSASLRLRGTQIQGPMEIGDGINGGAVLLDVSNQINDAASVTVNSDGSFILGPFGSVSETIDGLIGSGTVAGSGNPGTNSLTVGANGGSATFSGSIQNGGLSTTLSITKIGGGAQILTGANTYGGGTTVNGGTLLVNNIAGSGTGSGTVNVNNNAALGGTGVISGPVNINNTAHLAPGAGAGILGTGSVAFGVGTNFDVDINGPSVGAQYDQLVVTGSAALGAANLNLTGAYTPVAGDSFTILQSSGGVTPQFSGLPQGALLFFNLQPLVIDYTANGNKNVVLSYDSTPTIQGGAGADDFTVSLDGSGNVVVMDGATTVMVTPQASLSGLVIDGNGGANTLLVDESNGILNIPITFNGGGIGSLTVAGYSGVQVTDTYTSTGPGHSGNVQIGAGGLISYTGLAPLTLSGTASDLIIDLSQTGVANSVVVADDGSAADPDATNNANTSAIYSTTNAFEYTQFTNPTNSLTVDLGNSGDTIAVQSMDAAFAPAGAAPFTISGGSGGDTYNVLATQDVGGGGYGSLDITAGGGNDTFNVSSNAPTNTGNLSAIVSTLNIDGGAGSNTLNVSESGSGSPDTVLVTSSQIASAITPFTINYSATGGTFGGGVNLSTGSADDTINVQSTLAGGTTTINTGNGNDTINVSGPLSGAVSILGGSQTTADVLNYDAGGQDVTLSANSIIAGAGQALIFSGIEQVNITNVGGVTVLGDGNANTLTLTRTGATTDAYQLDSAAPVSLDGATSFTFFGLGGADHMQINETAAGLPQFTGTAQFSHTNSAFAASSLAPGNVGIDFSGVATASLGVNFLNSHDVTYFDDNASFSKSGVVNVAGQFTLSFDGMAPVNFTGAGGTLTVNTLADPTNTNLTVADDGTPGDGVSQITGDGGFETTTFSGFSNLVVQGLNAGGEMITLAGLDSATTLSNVTLQGGAGFDIINVQSLPATVAAVLLGGGGGNNFKLDNVAHNLQQIAGPVVVSPAGDVGAVGNALFLYDYGDATSRTVQVTSSTIEGITGFAGGPDITYGAGSQMTSVSILGGGGGNTFNVQSTRAGTSYYVNSGAGNDTVNVSSTAPAVNGNGTLTGDLNGIQGELDLVSDVGNDSLNVSDYGGVGRNYTVASPGAGVTLISSSGAANIVYNFAGVSTLEHFNLVGAAAGGNVYNVANTTATISNVVSDGDASGSGNSTFSIQADQLQAGASNSFNGFAGDDLFNLNFAAGASVPSAPGTTLSVDGGGLATGNDRVNVNANQASDGPRTVQINYQAGNAVTMGGLGTASVIQVNGTRQVNYYGDTANDDRLQITTPTAGAHTLSVTPVSANSADLFLDGSPLLAGTATATNNPGVAGGGAGPDLFVGGVNQNMLEAFGGSSGPGVVNKLIVNAPSENLNGAATTSAWGGNAFGSLPSIQPAGSAFNTISVLEPVVSIVNNALGALLNVNIGSGGFVPAGVSPAPATIIVNSGDQAGVQGSGIADNITVTLSPNVRFQVNGGLPPASAAPNGDQLNVFTPNDVEIWSDAATPPNVSIASSGLLPVTYSSIERLNLTPGNGIVNIYGDNNDPAAQQNDGYRVVGTGPNAFSLQISGDKNNPASFSAPIFVNGVTTLNAFGGDNSGGAGHNPEVTNTGVDALDITPFADNTPQGWGVQTFWNEGDPVADGDLLIYNGVSGVSESINVQPSGSQAGQVFSTNAATGTPIAVINYVLNTDIVVNGNDGSAGDTDTLTLYGTDPANPGASGQDNFTANFAAAGTPAAPMVAVTHNVGGAPLYTLDNFTNINTLNVKMLGGSDVFNLISGRNDGSLTVNVDGGAPSGPGNADAVRVDGTAGSDTFSVSPGASNDAGRITAQLAGATAPTVLNFTTTENVAISGGGGPDNVTLDGTGSNDSFALANGTAQVNSGAPIALSGFGAGSALNLNGLGGANSFAIDQATGAAFGNVNVNGGPAGNSSAAITGTNADDAINFTPISASSGQIAVTSGGTTNYNLSGVTSASIDALGQTTGDSLTTATAGTYVNTPGAQPGSGTVQVTLPGNIATLPLSYANVENVSFSGTTLVVNGTSGNDNVAVAADGSVTVNGNPVATAGFNALVLNLLGGTDSVSIAASANFPGGILVNGAGQTSVSLTGTAGDDTIAVDAAAGTVSGIVAGPIALIGVQSLTVDGGGAAAGDAISVTNLGVPGGLQSINVAANAAAGDTLQVSGSGGPDNMLVTPTGPNGGTLQDSGVGPVVAYNNFSAAGALQVTANALTVNGSAGDDNIAVSNVSPTIGRVIVGGDLPVNYNTSATALNIMGLGGGDSLTVDSTTGAVTTPIYYDGGAGSNSLTLTGGTATSDIYSPGAATGQGLSTLVIGGQTESVHFVNLAPVIDNVAGPLVVNGTNGDDAITAGASPNAVSVNNLETIAFSNKTGLTLNGLAGNDSFAITPSNLSLGGGTINVNGAAGANSTLTVNAAATIGYNPTAPGAGNVTTAGNPTVNFANIASAAIVGDGAGDVLSITPAVSTEVSFTAGATEDSGSLTFSGANIGGTSLTPLVFSNLGHGSLTIANSGGAIDFHGPDAATVFNATVAGIVQMFKPLGLGIEVTLPITATAAAVRLVGHSGNDTFSVPGNQPFGFGLQVQGVAGNNTLNFTSDGAGPVSIDLAAHTVQETGFAPVSFLGIETINVNAAGALVTVLGTAGNDDLSYTPSGTGAGTLTLAGLNATFNLSSAGTLSLDPLGGVNSVAVNGTANADAITVLPSGANTTVQVGGLLSVALVSADTQALVVNGGLGNDTLSVNATGSTNPVAIPITYDGGADINALTLRGTATSDAYTPGPQPGSGSNTIVYAGGSEVVNFVNLSPIFDFVVAPLVVNGTNAANAINYSVGFNNLANFLSNTPVATWGQVSIDGYEPIEFINKTTLTINGLAGDDAINLNNPNTPTGLTAINVNGGDPTASDTLVVNGTAGADAINYTPASDNSGTVAGLGPVVNVSSVEHLVVNGQGGNDALTVTTPNGGAEIGYLPGATRDAGSVSLYGFFAASALLPVDFSGLGSFGSVTFINAGGGRPDGLDIHGTSSDDRFDVSSAGTVRVVKPTFGVDVTLPINTPGVTLLRLIGEAGDDVFNIPGNTPFPNGVNVQGGDPSASDVLNFTGSGVGAVTVDLTAQTITEAGFAPVSFTGVEHVNVNANGQAVSVNDNSGPNTLEVTPTGANSALLQVQGANLAFNLTNAASLALGFTPANNNQLVVNATPNATPSADTINVSGTSVSIVGLLAVNETGVASLTVNGLEGSDTFNVAAAAIPIHINGGDPIGVLPGDTLNILAGGNPVQFFAGPHVDEGGFVIGANAEISYQQIESIGAIINPGPVLIVGTNGSDDIQVIARDASYITSGPVPPGLDGTQDFTVSVNQGPNLLFVDATQGLFIDALSGDDQVDVRAPAPNNAPWNMQVTVAGGAPAGQPGLNGDDFTFETPGNGNHVLYQPTGIDTGIFALTQTAGGADSTVITLNSFTIPAPPLANPYVSSAGGFESLTYDGQGANDVLAVNGTAGNDTITSTPGAADDAGTIAVNSLLALSYKNLGAGGSLAAAGNGGTDTLVVDGTAGVDSFVVDAATGTVHVNNRTPIQQLGMANLVLNGLGGDNTYSITAGQPYSSITVNGSGNSDPDVLNLAGDGSSPVTVNLGGPTQTVSGGGLGVVDITGVGIVNLSNATGAINVQGTTGPDSLSVTPTGTNTVTIQDGALAPVLNTTNTGTLSIVEGTAGDGDTVAVHGSSNSDVINVVQGATTTVQVGAFKQVSINTANVEALVVDGGLGADTFNISGAGGPALTVQGGQTPAADTLNLATVNASVTYGTDPDSGAIDTGAGVVNFADIKTINLTGNTLGSLVVNATNGNDAINQLNSQVTVNNGAVVNFAGYASLALNGLAGNDQFNVNPTTLPAGMTFNVNGGTSTSGDSLVVNGSAAQDLIGFAPSGANAGSVAIGLSPVVPFTSIGNVSINGQGGNDLLTATTPAGADAITYNAGATVDAASVQVGSLVPMSFTNLGATGTVTLADTSGNPVDSLLYNGTAGNDTFGVNATGIVFLNSQLQVSIPGIASLTLDGQGGVNAFSVAGNMAIPVNVNGGSASAGNSLSVFGDGAAPLTVDLGNRTVQEAGFGLISFNGLSQVTVDAAGQNINVVGGAGDDDISYTPSGTDAGSLELAGLSTVFNLSAVGNLSVDPLGGTNTVTVNGNANSNTIDVARGANTSVTVDALQSIGIVSADAQTVIVNSGLGDDTINVSGSASGITPELAINGGSPAASDTLNVTANGFTSVFFGANSTSGTIATADPQIAFSDIESISLTGDTTSSLSVFATNGNDAINLNENVVTVNAGTSIGFIDYPTLNLLGQNGDDAFNVWPTTTAGLNAINIDGGDPTASDQLIVNGSSAAETIGFNPTAADAGSVSISGSPTVNFTTTESVVINGQGGNDALSVTTPAGADNITYAAGATTDSASVQVGSLVPMQFKNLGAAASVTLADTSGGRVDTLVYSGAAANDTFTVAAGGAVTLNSQLAVSTPGISNLTLNGLGGDDTFNVTAPQPFASISLAGGDPSASDVVNLTGDGSAVSLAMGGSTTTVTGGGLGIVLLTSDETLNLDAAGGAVTTTDSTGPNTLDVTPTGAAAATLQIEGQSPVVNLTNSGVFNVNFTGAGDSLVVNGTTGPDLINASGSAVAVNALLAVNYAGATALTVNGSTGSDTFNVTPDATVAIHVNGGDPIGVLPGDTLNIIAGGNPVSFFAGPHSDEGGFQVGANAAVSFQQIESIGPIVGPGPVLILGTNGSDDIQVIARDSSYNALADGVQDYTVSVNQGPNILFINAPNLFIDALSGDDQVDVRAPAPNGAVWNTQVTIAGGAPAGQPGLNGDDFTLETPGAGNAVTYQPTNIDGGVFTFSASTVTLTSAPFTIPAINYTSSAGGFESAAYDGQGGNAALTILGTAGNDTITHTAGAANDAGAFAVNSLLALSYKNLGATGSILVDGNGVSSPAGDTLVVNGTANNDAFTVDATTGTVHMNSRVAIAQTGITNLVLNGYNPNNTFNLNASLPYASTTVNSIDPATLNLLGTAGAEAIGVDLTNSQITGFGGVVNYVGVAIVNMNGNGGADSLTVTGTTNDDVITYKPTSSDGGTFSQGGVPVAFNFNIGAGNVFTVLGGGGNGGDEVHVLGNNAGSVITVDSPNRTVSVENALNVVLMPVVLGTDVQVASVAGGLGNNTILVIPARNVPAGTDIVGPGFVMPNNLLVHVDGGAVPANAALVVADTNGATLNNTFFAVVNRTSNTSGVVRLFQSTGGPAPIQYPDISYANVGIVQASTAVNAATHQQQTLTMGPDTSDPNGSLNNAAYLGSGASINATNLTIFPNAFEHRFLQAEQDWFRVVAQFTGTMDFQVYFKQYAGFLPGGGELQIQVYDAAGNQITAFGVNDTDSDQRRRIPVVAGETYYLQVYGITQNPAFTPADGFDPTNATVNAYSLSITNTPAPSPDSLGLNNIVAQGSINNAIAPTTTTFSASNAAVPPPPTQPLPPLSSIDGFYVGKLLEFTSGSLVGQRQVVTAYVGATHTFTFASGFSAAPAVGDKFQVESNDTGRSQLDNVTRDNTPTIYIRLDAANTPTDGLIDLQGGGSSSQTPPNNTPILIPFWAGDAPTPPNSPANNGSFRVAVYDNTNPQSPLFLGYAIAVPGQQGVFQLQVTTPLSEGTHILAAKVEIDSPSTPSNKDLSAAATTQIVVDTLAPPVYFGSPTVPNSGLLGSSDTGVSGQPATIVDRITADSTPTLYGAAEANAVVRLYSDTNHNGIVDNGDVFLGLTTATPVDGTNQFPSGQWQITSSIDLNNPNRGFPLDGVRHLLVTAEDVSGNVSAPQALTIFIDTQGPTVKNVSVTGSPGFDLFAVKANTVNPTPLVSSLDITFNDQPIRVGPNFVYPAVNPILATTPGNYILIGDATGRVVITSVTFSDSTASGTIGMSVATLHFAAPLPDDRYTLTISDNITDNAGNNLDGEFGPTFSSGNGKIGGQFLGRFTVDSRPELGTYSSGSVSIDLNGNVVFDPQNLDQANRDTTFAMGFSTDRLFAGKFADAGGVVNGFDKLGAYGFLNGQWRWLLDLDGDGVIDPAKGDLSIVEPLALDALPVAGNWTNSPTHADQIGLFDGKTWWLDMNGDHVIDATDVALGGELQGNMKGLPIVGDFDGDGKTDLGTFANGVFSFDLSSKDPGGKLTGNTNAAINVQTDLPNNIGFAGVLARPVAADMDHDGVTDIGLFVPGRTQNAAPGTAEWYWLISNDPNGTKRATGTVNTLNHPFDPTPLGHDNYAQFGNQFALPLVGNFDPPANGGAGGTQSSGGNWIQNLYLDVLGRSASSAEVTYWTDQVNHGVTASQIATLFLTSTEHRSQLINTLYQQYLGRQADQAGINYWIGIWNATGGPEAVQAGIIGSAEYYNTAGGTDAAWVTALYQNILGRTVDAQGLAYWTDYIKTHTKQSVVTGFVTSDEYRLGLINGWFQVFLGRTLDASGAQYWLNQMKQGETQEQIQAGILGSDEFRNR